MELTNKQIIIAQYLLDELKEYIEESDPYTCGVQWQYTEHYKKMSPEELFAACNQRANADMDNYSDTILHIQKQLEKLEEILNLKNKNND